MWQISTSKGLSYWLIQKCTKKKQFATTIPKIWRFYKFYWKNYQWWQSSKLNNQNIRPQTIQNMSCLCARAQFNWFLNFKQFVPCYTMVKLADLMLLKGNTKFYSQVATTLSSQASNKDLFEWYYIISLCIIDVVSLFWWFPINQSSSVVNHYIVVLSGISSQLHNNSKVSSAIPSLLL